MRLGISAHRLGFRAERRDALTFRQGIADLAPNPIVIRIPCARSGTARGAGETKREVAFSRG
jgi:hypothetical protein